MASRSELSDAAAKIVPLDEAAQAAMARRLLDAQNAESPGGAAAASDQQTLNPKP